jgi:hypothetical protein
MSLSEWVVGWLSSVRVCGCSVPAWSLVRSGIGSRLTSVILDSRSRISFAV